MKSSRTLVLAAGIAAAGLGYGTAGAPAVASATTETTLALSEKITLVHQDLALEAAAPLVITFHPEQPITADETVRVTVYPRIDERRELSAAIDGEFSRRAVDTLDIDPAAMVLGEGGDVTITIATDPATPADQGLNFPIRGLYPVVIDIGSARTPYRGQLVTFVDRMSVEGEEELGSLSVAVLASIDTPPAVPGTNTPLPAETRDAIEQLGAYPANVPLSVSMSPEILERLDATDLAKVHEVLSRSLVMSKPRIPFDPSAAAAADQGDLFTTLLVEGESTVASAGEVAGTDRSAWYAPGPISTAGASLLRDLGVRSLVISPDDYFAADGNLGSLTDFSQLFLTRLEEPDDQHESCATGLECIPTAIVDPLLTDRLEDTSLDAEQAAMYMAADLVVYRDQLAAVITPVRRHGLVLALDGGGVPDPTRVSRLVDLATATGAVEFASISDFEQTSSNLLFDGLPRDLTFPTVDPVDLSARAKVIQQLTFSAGVVGSMLVDDNGRARAWKDTTATLWSTSVTDRQVDQAADALNAQFEAITAAVVPPAPYTFSLSGRSTSLPLRIRNTSAERLQVKIRLSAGADKLTFPDGDKTVILEALTSTPVEIKVVARTNGTFTVNLQVLAPDGQIPIAPTTVLKARVNALTGLAQVLTGGALLVLLTWWVRHLRRGRRVRRNAQAMSGHPAMIASNGHVVDASSPTDIDAGSDASATLAES